MPPTLKNSGLPNTIYIITKNIHDAHEKEQPSINSTCHSCLRI